MRFFVALIVALWAFAFFSRECNLVVVTICMVLCCIFSLIPTLVIDFFKHDRNEAIKYVVICIAVFNCMILSSVFSHMALVVWIFPILLTSLYYNKTLVVFTALMSTVGVILADFINLTYCDFMVAPIYLDYTDSMVLSVFPCVITILILSLVAYFIVSRNSTMLNSVIDNAEEVKSNQKELIFAFAELSESKSKYTGEHIKRVADYMRVLGKASGFDDDYVDKLSTAAMMHDIGKLMISEEILDKPGKLTDEEFAIMKSHVLYGDALLEHCPGEIMQIAREPASLETPIGEEEDSHLGDFIQDDNVPVPADAAAFTLLKEQLVEVLSTLTDREQKVLRLRFGLDDGRARTLEEVGKEFNVTRERIRQIEAKALRKLRNPVRSKKIKDFLNN